MVEGFLKEYPSVGAVIGTELHTVGCYFSGFLSASGLLVDYRALKDYFGDRKTDIGIGSSSVYDHLFISLCKEGGPIGLIQNGDIINVDIQNMRIDVLVSDEEMEARRKKWTAPPYKANQGALY